MAILACDEGFLFCFYVLPITAVVAGGYWMCSQNMESRVKNIEQGEKMIYSQLLVTHED